MNPIAYIFDLANDIRAVLEWLLGGGNGDTS